jgi:hypothetical protein
MEVAMTYARRVFTLAALSLLLSNAPVGAEEAKMKKPTDCKSGAVITNADGKDGTNNNGPDSGNGAKGGTVKVPCNAKGMFSANGGNGGSNNGGEKSGNGGAGGSIEF